MVAMVVAMVGVGVWIGIADSDNFDVGDCLANVPSASETNPPLPGRRIMPAGDVEEVSCSDPGAEMRVVEETGQTCDTVYAISIGETEYCLDELGT